MSAGAHPRESSHAPRRERMLVAFRVADRRGLTRRQLAQEHVGGAHWRRHLERMEEDGFVFHKDRSKFDRAHVWRWMLAAEPLELLNGQSCPVPAQGALLELDVEPQCALLEGVA